MANTIELKQQIAQGEYDAAFAKLYGADAVQEQRKRYTDLIDEFEKKYGTNRTVRLYSAPGRTEIGGNHTDHNNGVVLAGSVNLDMVAVVSPNEENVIRVKSLGFDKIDDVDVTNLVPQPRETEHSASLIRGVAKGIVDAGGKVGGFDCYTTSNVLRGSGLSSSAAFEVCIGAILRGEYNNNDMEKFNQVKIARSASMPRMCSSASPAADGPDRLRRRRRYHHRLQGPGPPGGRPDRHRPGEARLCHVHQRYEGQPRRPDRRLCRHPP